MIGRPSWILIGGEGPVPPSSDLVGGKGANLERLLFLGLPVPRWFALASPFFDALTERVRPEVDRVAAGLDPARGESLAEAGEAIARVFAELEIAAGDARAILAAFDECFGGETRVAVRSSAVGEDSARDSFAGQMETWLHVPRRGVLDRVKACCASAYAPRALLYRRLRGEGTPRARTAVLVQEMVESRASGILFTVNPASGDEAEVVVAGGYGLGEGIVSDRVQSDTWFVDRRTLAVRDRRIVRKAGRIVPAPDGSGTVLESVPDGLASRPALADRELAELVGAALRIEAAQGCPQDVEWAYDLRGRLAVTQTRPITTLRSGRERLFDNSNIVEGYPGVTTPLTFSFVRRAYEVIFRAAARAFGVPEGTIAREDALFENMVGLIEGRIYYNLGNWYRLYGLVPGFEGRVAAWEEALGLDRRTRKGARSGRRGSLRTRAAVAFRIVRLFRSLDRDVARFEERFRAASGRFRGQPLSEMSADALLELHESLVRDLLFHWETTIVNDFFAFQLYDALGKLLARWAGDETGSLRNDLLAGLEGVESVEPVRSLLSLAGIVRADPEIAALFDAEEGDAALWEALRERPEAARFREELARHLERYGDRTVRELQLETPGAEEDPAYLVRLVRTYLAGGHDAAGLERREGELRQRAEEEFARRFAGRPVRRRLARYVLERTRASVKYRENMRLARSRAFGMVKRIFRALGRILASRGRLVRPEDVFYLTVDEIAGFVRGASVCRRLADLVAIRREEFAAYPDRSPAPRIATRDIVYHGNSFEAPPAGSPDAEGTDVLRGLGSSPGRARARARIVVDPASAPPIRGEILVAPMTDPGWVYLMVASSGLVVERGSLLSHTAIIGRELGIPTVVAVEGATRRIADGREIEVDGAAGTVRLL